MAAVLEYIELAFKGRDTISCFHFASIMNTGRLIVSKWLFVVRTISDVNHLFQPLKECFRHTFIPAVPGHSPPGDLERESCWLCLPELVAWVLLIQLNCVLLNPQKKLSSHYSLPFCPRQMLVAVVFEVYSLSSSLKS